MKLPSRPNCSGHLPYTRRHFLFGSVAATGASLLTSHADAEVVAARNASPRSTARAVVFFNLNGAASQMDTFDPKDGPWNPRDVDLRQNGPFVLSNRFFPGLSRHLNDLLLLRSCASWEAAHERGQFYMQTAHSQNPALAGETPHIGAVIAQEKGGKGSLLPPFLSFNQTNLQGATFLGGANQPMMPPATRNGITTLSHNFFGAAAQSRERFERRFALLEALDAPLRGAAYNPEMAAYAGYYNRAKSMMYNDAVDNVFKFSADDENRYGATGVGRAAIVTRNAIRANNGAIFFNITQGGWDTHDGQFNLALGTNIYTLTRDLDRAVTGLVDDLKASGHLGETLIVVMGEFGRTPGPLNSRNGRDHYRDVMSVAMLGGGVRGNRVIGATDATSSKITEFGWSGNRPIYPEDITATIYSALGIDWTRSILDTPSGRRYDYIIGAREGRFQPVEEIWG
jgi:hypothetical protein